MQRHFGHRLRQCALPEARIEFAPRVRSAHGIIVAFAGLVHDAQVGFSGGEEVHCVHNGAIDGKSTLATTGNKDTKGFFRFARGDGEKFGTNGIASEHGFDAKFFRSDGVAGGDLAREAR